MKGRFCFALVLAASLSWSSVALADEPDSDHYAELLQKCEGFDTVDAARFRLKGNGYLEVDTSFEADDLLFLVPAWKEVDGDYLAVVESADHPDEGKVCGPVKPGQAYRVDLEQISAPLRRGDRWRVRLFVTTEALSKSSTLSSPFTRS